MIKKILILTTLVCTNLFAMNPGIDANKCIDTRADGHVVTLTNNCVENVYVFFCGDIKFSQERCGSLTRNAFYTHINNLKPFGKIIFELEQSGIYFYGACFGVAQTPQDAFEDYPNGDYKCLRR